MRIALLLICSFIYSHIFSQESNFSFRYNIGIATFSMNNFKQFNSNYIKALKINAKVVDNFQPNYFNEVTLFQRINKNVQLGIKYKNASTGSRIHYMDYSGEYYNNFVLNSNSFGISSMIKVLNYNGFFLETGVSIIIISSKIEIHENCKLLTYELWDIEDTFKSDGYGLDLSVEPYYQISNHLDIGVKVTYTISTEGKIHRYDYLQTPQVGAINLDSEITKKYFSTNWSGISYGISIGIKF